MKKAITAIVFMCAVILGAAITGDYNTWFGYLAGEDASGNRATVFGAGAGGGAQDLYRTDLIGAAADRFGSQCVVVNIDPKRVLKDGKEFWEVFINGGRIPTGLEAVAWAREVESRGAGEIVLTSMDGDGTKNGYDLPILKAVADAVRIPVVASGGAGEPKHFVEAITEANASAVLAASVFHYGLYSIAEVKEAMRAAGVPVRV